MMTSPKISVIYPEAFYFTAPAMTRAKRTVGITQPFLMLQLAQWMSALYADQSAVVY